MIGRANIGRLAIWSSRSVREGMTIVPYDTYPTSYQVRSAETETSISRNLRLAFFCSASLWLTCVTHTRRQWGKVDKTKKYDKEFEFTWHALRLRYVRFRTAPSLRCLLRYACRPTPSIHCTQRNCQRHICMNMAKSPHSQHSHCG